jgi:hypothetical protein
MKILEWYDLAVIYFLYTLSLVGSGFGGSPMSEQLQKKDLPEWVMWLARIMLGSAFILASFAC